MKQGKEKFEFVKDEDQPTENYIFQKNKKTKLAFFFVAAVLLILIVAVSLTLSIS